MTDNLTPAQVAEILASPATSYWLKDAIKAALARDSVDALNDAETLVRVLMSRGLMGRPE